MKKIWLRLFFLLIGFALIFSSGQTVLAQDDEAEDQALTLEEVIVTGSRIAREEGFGKTSPVVVMGAEDIDSYGFTRVEDILFTMPQIETNSAENAFQANPSVGTAAIDLRGMSPKRTLTLMNGRRMQPGGVNTQSVDVNQIPAAMIERIEVLTGGASAVYGPDAVAGVVNFIMRRVDGLELTIGGSGYQHNNDNSYMQGLQQEVGYQYPVGSTGLDGGAYNIDLIMGGDFAGGKGNATVYANYRENKAVLQGDRDYSSCALGTSGLSCSGSSTTPLATFDIFPVIGDVDGGDIDWAEELWGYVGTEDSGIIEHDGSYTYNYAPPNHLQRPDERWSLGAFADYEINDKTTAYLEAQYFSDNTHAQIAESGTFYAVADYYPLSQSNIPAGFAQSVQDYFTNNYSGTYGANDWYYMYIAKRNVEGGPRDTIINRDSRRIVAGLKGDIADGWGYDVSYLKAKTIGTFVSINDLVLDKAITAIDPAACAADSDCIPYEVFTYGGPTTAAANSIAGVGQRYSETSIEVVSGIVNGKFDAGLPAGDIYFVVGLEQREEIFETTNDTMYAEGLLLGMGGKREDLGGGFKVRDLFGEVSVPLVSDMPGVENLTLDLALRDSDHSTAGPANTWRVGLDWKSNSILRVRANYNRAVRSPNIEELYYQTSVGLWGGTDGCAGATPIYTAEQCARTGIPVSRYGTISANPADQYYAEYGGNLGLQPEEAKTITLGVVLSPMARLKVSVDYWNIQIDDTIDTIGEQLTIDLCATQGSLCNLIHRAPGSLSLWLSEDGFVDSKYQNIGEQNFEGIDLAGAYWMNALGGTLNFNINGTYLLTKETTPIADDPSSMYDCVGNVSADCYPSPEWKHVASVNYDSNEFWSVMLRWRYIGKSDYVGNLDKIIDLDPVHYFDLSALFKFGKNHDFAIGINNVLDEEPPLVGGSISGAMGNGNAIVGYYDTLGRFGFARATFRF